MPRQADPSAVENADLPQEASRRFSSLFRGYDHAHGEHELCEKPDESGKLKGRAVTKSGAATDELYRRHLEGKGASLGVIPLLADDTCSFGAIDIDIRGEVKLSETVEQLEGRVRKLELPLVVCRSKSGGAHLYLFASSPIGAKLLQAKLSQFAALLGYGGCEIFPKQVMRADAKDFGNWINIAYYGSQGSEGTQRYAIRNGKSIRDLGKFLKYAEMMRMSVADLSEVQVKLVDMFTDGPPCLQYLATVGVDEGGRNNALTNIAIYYKKSKPMDWQDAVNAFNFQRIKPPLSLAEVSQILKHVSRKDYFYTCKQPPLVNHCDKKLCRQRQFGIGGLASDEGELFPIDNLTKCTSKGSVRWYAEHQGCRIELTTEQLFSPVLLQKVFAERFTTVILLGKRANWHVRLKELMQTSDEVQDPEDASEQGQFENMLGNFFTGSRPARNRDELIKGNSYAEDGRVYFRSEDLFNYLKVRRFQHNPHQVWRWLKTTMGATDCRMSVKGKDLRVWSLPEPARFEATPIALPPELTEEEL